MTKKVLIFTCFVTVLLNGMQKEDETISLLEITKNSLSLICNKTKIHLTKEPLLNVANKVNYTIVGDHQQALLSGKFNAYTVGAVTDCPYPPTAYLVGRELYFKDSRIYTKNNDDDSGSEDDNCKPYPYSPEDKKEKLYEGIFTKITSDTRIITEPCINTLNGKFIYNVLRKNQNYTTTAMGYDHNGIGYSISWHPHNGDKLLQFTGDEAIQAASNDLSMCYREILRIMADYYSSADNPKARYTRPHPKSNINIAIPLLSTDVGFPRDKATPIAIAAILDFLQEYPEGYDNIYLVVKKRSEFTLGKKSLMKYYRPIHAIYLYWIHKDTEQDISQLPKEIIDSIVLFMLNS